MAIFEAKKKRGTLGFWYCLFVILISTGNWNCGCAARSEKEIRERFYGSLLNSSAPDSSDGSIAKMFDRVLEKEFSENDQPEERENVIVYATNQELPHQTFNEEAVYSVTQDYNSINTKIIKHVSDHKPLPGETDHRSSTPPLEPPQRRFELAPMHPTSSILHGLEKNVLVVGTKVSSVLTLDSETGNMLTTSRVQPKKPSKALFMQSLDGQDPNAPYLSKRNSLEDAIPKQFVLLCSEKAVYVYYLTHIIQGVKKVHYKKCFKPLLVAGHQHFIVPLMLTGLFSFLLVEKFSKVQGFLNLYFPSFMNKFQM